jgi:hypothetical protein
MHDGSSINSTVDIFIVQYINIENVKVYKRETDYLTLKSIFHKIPSDLLKDRILLINKNMDDHYCNYSQAKTVENIFRSIEDKLDYGFKFGKYQVIFTNDKVEEYLKEAEQKTEFFEWARKYGSEKLKLYIEENYDWKTLAIHEYAKMFSDKFPLYPKTSFSKLSITQRNYPEIDDIKHLKKFKLEQSKSNYKFEGNPEIAWAELKNPYFGTIGFDIGEGFKQSPIESECIKADLIIPNGAYIDSIETISLIGSYARDTEDSPF